MIGLLLLSIKRTFASLVQSGWLRASHRALRDDATELRPTHSHRFEDIAPLVPGEWVQVRVEIMPFGHVFHAGSRIRVMIDTPGDSTTRWRFRLLEHETPPTIEIGHDAAHSSRIALPWVPTVEVPRRRSRRPAAPCVASLAGTTTWRHRTGAEGIVSTAMPMQSSIQGALQKSTLLRR